MLRGWSLGARISGGIPSLNHAAKGIHEPLRVGEVEFADVFDGEIGQRGEQEVFLFAGVFAVLGRESHFFTFAAAQRQFRERLAGSEFDGEFEGDFHDVLRRGRAHIVDTRAIAVSRRELKKARRSGPKSRTTAQVWG
nr:hypothetical protein WS70_13330 [Burkholderia mayonis]